VKTTKGVEMVLLTIVGRGRQEMRPRQCVLEARLGEGDEEYCKMVQQSRKTGGKEMKEIGITRMVWVWWEQEGVEVISASR
jgi:hypothetical protein